MKYLELYDKQQARCIFPEIKIELIRITDNAISIRTNNVDWINFDNNIQNSDSIHRFFQ